jgi:hypothetical protein
MRAMTKIPNRLAPRDDGAMEQIRELFGFLIPDSAESFLSLFDHGADFFALEVDREATARTGEYVVIYKPSEALTCLLAAFRARNRQRESLSARPERLSIVGQNYTSNDTGAESVS